ncbi:MULTISPECIES: hypothetical protein [Mycolicibacterium]|jgi:hypothetical protein|uniref:hypothetical protein n=1 Tax=Mycolicibacterium TaxID=1866885 RepID=UPI000AF61DB6|nr:MULTISPECIES: hypothetical protein [Mycolicibacterium]MBP3082249.1 hypothetical protein [Mycolicibacterium fortuitum]MCA4752163.1 hypothetical protein [Mycolicibacterium fortuitum]MDG5773850.1 hypothetical protein [Mycolicibacterium fortuitum]MDG5779900.1 hypothetical protein [Mycolicibacterium fortuitum]NOP95294.1 hypothetical protein [Mycolicibacterium fortuitum]
MQHNTFLRHAHGLIKGPIAWIHTRASLTPQERHNLRMSNTPVAVLTASLGGGSHHAG